MTLTRPFSRVADPGHCGGEIAPGVIKAQRDIRPVIQVLGLLLRQIAAEVPAHSGDDLAQRILGGRALAGRQGLQPAGGQPLQLGGGQHPLIAVHLGG